MVTIQAVFLDLGDTLTKTSSDVDHEICRRIGEVRGTSLSVEEYTRASHDEWRRRSTAVAASSVKNIPFGAEARERQYWENYFESLLPRLGVYTKHQELINWLVDTYTNPASFVCFDEVHDVLSELQEKGITLGIISNAFPSAEKTLDHLNLRQYFKYIFLSFELPYAKPESMIYQFAAKKANLPIEDIIFVDDRLSFVQGAEAVNMNAWLIDRFVDDPSKSITKPLVLNKIGNLRELIQITDFFGNETLGQKQKQHSFSVNNQNKSWEFCELPTINSSRPVYEETYYVGKPTISADFSRLTQ